MSLAKCPQCQNPINNIDLFCPRCGYSIKENSKGILSPTSNVPIKKNNGCGIAILFFFGIAFIGFLINKCSETEENSDLTTNVVTQISKEDSIKNKLKIDSINNLERMEEEKFLKSKAGKIYKKHPEWSKEDCISISENKIWIGMQYDMLVYMRGKPDNVNTSNYGNGPHYQACWHDYDASCFYFDESQIITSYN
ncbi:zinc ribbon domain-containing protein [Chryseobacterium sp.]|uniref:zinc ribbon domain-containing protein n=1 Tax=Chryseobacterium sp. TaxID=1871047 RepID=UPI003219077B